MPRGPAPSGRGPGENPARGAHAPGAVQPDPSWGWDVAGNPLDEADGWQPVPPGVDPMADPDEREAWLASSDCDGAPPDPEGDPGWRPDPADPALPDDVDLDGLRAESRRIAAGRAAEQAAEAEWAAGLPRDAEIPQAGVRAGRRGPGMPGSARRVPGEYAGPAGGFGTGQPLDVAPGGGVLLGFAEDAAGDADRFTGASDDELAGMIGALDRAEAAACSLKHAALAEFTRRRPAPGHGPEGPAGMPAERAEFAGDEIAQLLAEGRGAAEGMLDLAWDLEVKLPGTRAAFRAGIVRHAKAQVIAWATAMLDPGEARAAEELVLGRAGRLTPGGLRSAIARAVMQVAPEKARKRREDAAKDARVQRWAEDSGNAALAGRDLPPDEVLAADQRISWWARQLRKAGLEGSMDELRARAYLDLLLDKDSRPAAPPDRTTGTTGSDTTGSGTTGSGTTGSGTTGSGTTGSGTTGSGGRTGDSGSGGTAGSGTTDTSGAAPGGTAPGHQRRDRRRRDRRRRSGRGSGGRRVPVAGSGRAQDGAGGGGAAGRVRGAAAPDRAAGDLAGAGGPAGGDPGAGPGRPVAGPGPGPRRRRQPQDHLVPDRHRPAGPRHRARLRPADAQEPAQPRVRRRKPRGTRRTRPAGPARSGQPGRPRIHLRRRRQPGRAAGRVRCLAVRHRGGRAAGLGGRAGPDRDRDLRSPVRGRRA